MGIRIVRLPLLPWQKIVNILRIMPLIMIMEKHVIRFRGSLS